MTLTWQMLPPFFHKVEMPVKTNSYFDLDVICMVSKASGRGPEATSPSSFFPPLLCSAVTIRQLTL